MTPRNEQQPAPRTPPWNHDHPEQMRVRLRRLGWVFAGLNFQKQPLWRDPATGAAVPERDAFERLRRIESSSQT